MSKVQSPKSEDAENRSPISAQDRSAYIGHWTLDVGLSVSDLRKSFTTPAGERVDVLKSISFTVNAGEAIAIVGASGAGKSTLFHLLGGLDASDHGNINVGGFPLERASLHGLSRFRNRQ